MSIVDCVDQTRVPFAWVGVCVFMVVKSKWMKSSGIAVSRMSDNGCKESGSKRIVLILRYLYK